MEGDLFTTVMMEDSPNIGRYPPEYPRLIKQEPETSLTYTGNSLTYTGNSLTYTGNSLTYTGNSLTYPCGNDYMYGPRDMTSSYYSESQGGRTVTGPAGCEMMVEKEEVDEYDDDYFGTIEIENNPEVEIENNPEVEIENYPEVEIENYPDITYGAVEVNHNFVRGGRDEAMAEKDAISSDKNHDNAEDSRTNDLDISCQAETFFLARQEEVREVTMEVREVTMVTMDTNTFPDSSPRPQITEPKRRKILGPKSHLERMSRRDGQRTPDDDDAAAAADVSGVETTDEETCDNPDRDSGIHWLPTSDTTVTPLMPRKRKRKSKFKFKSAWDFFMELHSPKWQPFVKMLTLDMTIIKSGTLKIIGDINELTCNGGENHHALTPPISDDLVADSDVTDDDLVGLDEQTEKSHSNRKHKQSLISGNTSPDSWTRDQSVHPVCQRSSFRAAVERLHEEEARAVKINNLLSTGAEGGEGAGEQPITDNTKTKTTRGDSQLKRNSEKGRNKNIREDRKDRGHNYRGHADDLSEDNQSITTHAESDDKSETESPYYICQGCDKKFYENKYLLKHLKKYNYHKDHVNHKEHVNQQDQTIVQSFSEPPINEQPIDETDNSSPKPLSEPSENLEQIEISNQITTRKPSHQSHKDIDSSDNDLEHGRPLTNINKPIKRKHAKITKPLTDHLSQTLDSPERWNPRPIHPHIKVTRRVSEESEDPFSSSADEGDKPLPQQSPKTKVDSPPDPANSPPDPANNPPDPANNSDTETTISEEQEIGGKRKRLLFHKSTTSGSVTTPTTPAANHRTDTSANHRTDRDLYHSSDDDDLPDLIVTKRSDIPQQKHRYIDSINNNNNIDKSDKNKNARVQSRQFSTEPGEINYRDVLRTNSHSKPADTFDAPRVRGSVRERDLATTKTNIPPGNVKQLDRKTAKPKLNKSQRNLDSPPRERREILDTAREDSASETSTDSALPFHCRICKKGFHTRFNRKRHQSEVHMRDKPHSCRICDESFSRTVALRCHMIEMHSRNYRRVACDQCGSMFATEARLRRHIKVTHTNSKKYKCKSCNSKFSQRAHLRIHVTHVHENPTLYTCLQCHASFKTRFDLRLHVSHHLVDGSHGNPGSSPPGGEGGEKSPPGPKALAHLSIICEICSRGFRRQADLEEHRAQHRKRKSGGGKRFSCAHCEKSYSHKQSLYLHQRIHDEKRAHACAVCHRKFPLRSTLDIHMRIHTKEKPHRCPQCPKSFRTTANLNTHLTIHTGERPHRCAVCGDSFRLPVLLRAHEIRLKHGPPSPYTCAVCHAPFTRPFNLKQHMRIHSGERPFSCSICEKQFTASSTLASHMRTHSDARPFSCHLCEKTYKTKEMLRAHIRTHTGEKPFPCQSCSATFRTGSELNAHQIVHTKARPHNCPRCEKCYAGRSALLKHVRSHDGLKPHVCDVCGRGFNGADRLKVHKIRHSGEKPFKCGECPKSFSSNSSLYIHRKIHGGEREHACAECEAKFYTAACLRRHMLGHRGEFPFLCECGKKYRHKASLREHVIKHCILHKK